ncbi:MAG: hypothetical protein HY885_01550 [Deltaproteobacteria bacterium]|nr:hypothetical protein [Deltaproteobacteria bacterium]
MLINSWGLALCIISLCVLFLVGTALRSAVRVLRYWQPGSDSNLQIELENEIWLSSTLVEYGLGFQMVSLLIFIMAADRFAQMIKGAMCATGSLLANDYGAPLLVVKLTGIFLYGFWIVLHQLDMRAESYPLVRLKYRYLLALFPLLLLETTLQTLYLTGLSPDIITSCCAVVFGGDKQLGQNLIGGQAGWELMALFYGLALLLFSSGLYQLSARRISPGVTYVSGFGWFVFFILALVVITIVVSSYIYAMPYHHCPFCILKAEYDGIGYPIFVSLISACFAGGVTVIAVLLRNVDGLEETAGCLRRFSIRFSLVMLAMFLALSSWHFWAYFIMGGEY